MTGKFISMQSNLSISSSVSPFSIKEGVSGPYGIVGGKMLGPSSLTFSTNGLEWWE